MHPFCLRVIMTGDSAGGQGGEMPQGGGQMMLLLLMMIMMMMLVINPSVRNSLMDYADPVLSPIVPENSLILMVLTLGSASMVVNTILRSFFMDPVAQAHISHRQRQIGKMANEARLDQNKVALDTAMRMREKMLPDQMSVQMGAFKPMMFTMIFIIAIFAWLASSVENFRVDYLSLPWNPKWRLIDDKVMWFIPVWIFAYICMSAPLGRIIDRHIKLIRYRTHPIVVAGKTIKEPLLDEFRNKNEKKSYLNNSNKRKSRVQKQNNSMTKTRTHNSKKIEGECDLCGSSEIERSGSGKLRCVTCRHEWK
ncbi:MAG: hypothetical protein CMB56_002865 [Methanobacteriota archaeon]|nr:MAG: hypothetical protein CMB56_002865 [Euryarchaeota archaeon]